MDTVEPFKFIFAFMFVLGLLGLLAMGLKRFSQSKQFFGVQNKTGRVQIIETHYLDHKRRLVLIQRDNVEHLLQLGDGREVVIESGIITHAK